MTGPTSITLDVTYNADGTLDANTLILALEDALGGRLCITDSYSESNARDDYPHLNAEERRAVVSTIQTGDYDEAIDRDVARNAVDAAVLTAGFELAQDAEEDEDELVFNP